MNRRVHGFTLLEVIAAIAILALSSVVLMQALGASVALDEKASTRTQVAGWAQSLLDSADVMHSPRSGVTTGRFGTRYRWRLTVAPWRPPAAAGTAAARHVAPAVAPGMRLYKLDLAVTWGPASNRHIVHFDTLRVVRPRRRGLSP